MTSSLPTPSNAKLHYYYYLLFSLVLLASILLLITSAIILGCCTWLRRRFLLVRRLFGQDQIDLEMRFPVFKYHKKEEAARREEEKAALDCVICLSSFDDGEEVRQLPLCGHLFHAACIDVWLNSHRSCPMCRSIILPTSSHSVDI